MIDDSDALLGSAEVAEVLGIGTNKVGELVRRDPLFPEPFVRLRMGPVWLASQFRDYRLPGERWVRGTPAVLRRKGAK